MNEKRLVKRCRESLVVQTHSIFPNQLNNHGTLFGGELMSMLDVAASIAVTRHARTQSVTASTDSVDFLHPIQRNDAITIEAYVSGVGKSSVEVFCKVIGENLLTGEQYLAVTAFLTFVAFKTDKNKAIVPLIEPETEEELFICNGYEERNKNRFIKREFNKQFSQKITLTNSWMDED
ncbi:putative acyl-CoA hydrolase [Carnobacterium sp. 17-4]|uniref:acyl-CoA thioesterase n=1 Tax=Carnobacterium sp. (strain 17-4) TaxID=208596 RepID=UPI0002058918|nr:acyl-CoA thioesterase [Carnobacterium sp. 17-4]AEB30031.1 putative acyl-CoA hydrolase [Carnobacterium sp. 17-4]